MSEREPVAKWTPDYVQAARAEVDVPGGFVLVLADVDPGRMGALASEQVVVPSSVPGCRQGHQPAWRTADAAEAARVGLADRDRWRVRWVPAVPDPVRGQVLLDLDAWRGIGGPIVFARDHFAEHPWQPGESRLHVLTAPPEDVRREIHRAYQPLLADQPGLAQVPPEWLHLTLCALPTVDSAAEEADTALRLAEKLQADIDHKGTAAPRVSIGPATFNAQGIQLDVAAKFEDSFVRTSHHEPLGFLAFSASYAAGVAEPSQFWRPHLTIAYTHNTAAAGCGLIDGTGVYHQRHRWDWTASEVMIAAVTQDSASGFYRWRLLHTVSVPPYPWPTSST